MDTPARAPSRQPRLFRRRCTLESGRTRRQRARRVSAPPLLNANFRSMIFFFSSRRRHTRSLCDWSSDVCSSDLGRELDEVFVTNLVLREQHEMVVYIASAGARLLLQARSRRHVDFAADDGFDFLGPRLLVKIDRPEHQDRKSTRLNSSHTVISYA